MEHTKDLIYKNLELGDKKVLDYLKWPKNILPQKNK